MVKLEPIEHRNFREDYEIKHYNWMLQDMYGIVTKQSVLFQKSVLL